MSKPRGRDLGLDFPGATGTFNAITDVPGVAVGFQTLRDEMAGICTGVTAIVPCDDHNEPSRILAGQYSLNGNGEMTGTHWISDAGYFFGPVCISNTHAVGMVHHGATRWMINRYKKSFTENHLWAMPVVAETYDGELNDINGLHVTAEDAVVALNGAKSGAVAEGNVGGGTGMICYGYKGGTGTSSRRVAMDNNEYTIGALVQANHGIQEWLTILGVPVGRHLQKDKPDQKEYGSIIVVLATDAPLSPLSLRHIAKRAAIGIGRGGTPGGNSSGDIFLAFSVANKCPLPGDSAALETFEFLNQDRLDPLYLAAVEAVEESVVNAIVAAEDVPTFKSEGEVCRAIDHQELTEVMRQYGRLKV